MERVSLKWYGSLIADKAILSAALNTLIVAAVSTLLATILGTMLAIGIEIRKAQGAVFGNHRVRADDYPRHRLAIALLSFFSPARCHAGIAHHHRVACRVQSRFCLRGGSSAAEDV